MYKRPFKKTDGFVAEIRNDSNTNDTLRKQISSWIASKMHGRTPREDLSLDK